MYNYDKQDVLFLQNLGNYMDAAYIDGREWQYICRDAIKFLQKYYDINTCQAIQAIQLATALARTTEEHERDELVWKYVLMTEAVSQAVDMFQKSINDTQDNHQYFILQRKSYINDQII